MIEYPKAKTLIASTPKHCIFVDSNTDYDKINDRLRQNYCKPGWENRFY